MEALDGKKIFDAFRKHDRIAEESVARYVEYLGEGIVNVINILQPDVLCIGGGGSARQGTVILTGSKGICKDLPAILRTQQRIQESTWQRMEMMQQS